MATSMITKWKLFYRKVSSFSFFNAFVAIIELFKNSNIANLKAKIKTFKRYIYRVSHNTWEYKNALGPPNDDIESWDVSHFEA
jgi:hypothetical protein